MDILFSLETKTQDELGNTEFCSTFSEIKTALKYLIDTQKYIVVFGAGSESLTLFNW